MASLRLYVTDIRDSDAGRYTCSAELATSGEEEFNNTSDEHPTEFFSLTEDVSLFLYGQ